MVITIIDFPFDSLANWKDPYDIKEVHPYLTMQECRLASNFHSMTHVEFKANALFGIVKSMVDSGELSEAQILFITELVNWDERIIDDLVAKFNKKAKSEKLDVRLELAEYE